MPSYSLANWDGHLSQQNQPKQDKPPPSTPLTFGSPTLLLKASKAKDLQGDTQPSVNTDGGVNQRVGTGGGVEGGLGVLSTAREYTLSYHLDGNVTSNLIGRDMLYHARHTNSQAPVGFTEEGRNLNLDIWQLPELVHTVGGGGRPGQGAITIDGMAGASHKASANAFADRAPDPGRAVWSSVVPLTQEPETYPLQMSSPYSPFNYASSEFGESALFTPPPQERFTRSLFTPSPIPAPRRRQLFSHVAVPGFPKGLTRKDYVRWVRKRGRPPMAVQVHQSIGEALQASLRNNADLGAPERFGVPTRPKPRPPGTKPNSLHNNASEQLMKPFEASHKHRDSMGGATMKGKSVNAIAGPSSTPLPTVHSQHSHGKVKRKQKWIDDDEFVIPKPPSKKRKYTIPSAESASGRIAKQPTRTHEKRRDTDYKAGMDRTQIFIHAISLVPSTVHTHNVRFIRTQLREQDNDLKVNKHGSGVVKVNEYHGKSWFLWPRPKLGYRDQAQDEISLGAHWNIWEDEDQDQIRPPTIGNVQRVPKKLKPVVDRADPSPAKSILETHPTPTPTPAKPPSPSNHISPPIYSAEPTPIHEPRRPSSSVPEAETESSESSFPTNDWYSDTSEHSPKPSAKSLGKRRAVSEELQIEQIEPLPLSPNQSPSPPPALETSLQNEMAPYLHTLGPVHPQFDPHLMQTTTNPFQSPERPLRGPNALMSPSDSPSQPYGLGRQHVSLGVDMFSEQRNPSPLSGLAMLSGYDPGLVYPWATSGSSASNTPNPTDSYGDGTIDPSLLGGNTFQDDEPVAVPSLSPLHLSTHSHRGFEDPLDSPSHQDPSFGPHSPIASNSYSSYEPSQASLRPSRSPSPRHSSTSDYFDGNSTSRLSQVFTRPRREARRIHQDMTAIEDLDLSISGLSDDDTFTKKKKKLAPAPAKRGRGKRSTENWPLDEEEAYCHQCRRKVNYMKLTCEDCSKKYCVRCLTLRYGERPESYDALADFVCPFCDDTCTCDVCTRRRGGTYNRIKGISKTTPSQAPRSPKLRNIGQQEHELDDKIGPPLEPITISGPVTYWGAMYDLTGQKIGTAFVGGNGNVLVRRQEATRRRVFVGAVQPSWDLGGSPIVKDLEPVVSRNPERGGKRLREYVGNRAILYYPVRADVEAADAVKEMGHGGNPMFAVPNAGDAGVGDSFASPLSSLSSLIDSDDEGGEGECSQWFAVDEADFGIAAQGGLDKFLEKGPGVGFSPNSLEDLDVVRAITLALRACGVGVTI